jgi:hypothetical protein
MFSNFTRNTDNVPIYFCIAHSVLGEDNINMDHGEIEWHGMNWIELAQDRDQWRAPVNIVI